MNSKCLHKIISVWTVILLLLPIGVQFAHAIENHEHVVCDSLDIQHIHKLELDCSIYHVKLTSESLVFTTNFLFTKPLTHSNNPIFCPNKKVGITLYYKDTRGPPKVVV